MDGPERVHVEDAGWHAVRPEETSPRLLSKMAVEAAKVEGVKADLRRRGVAEAGWVQAEGPGSAGIFWQELQGGERNLKAAAMPVREAAALSSVQCMAHWTQQRLFDHGKAEDPKCKLCLKEPGTLFHRRFKCQATEEHRRAEMPEWLRALANKAAEKEPQLGELFAAGLFPTPSGLAPRPVHSQEGKVKWINRPACGRVFGELATDGSGFHPRFPGLRRAGWAVAMLDQNKRVFSVAYGAVPLR